jgi:hypothetical protein
MVTLRSEPSSPTRLSNRDLNGRTVLVPQRNDGTLSPEIELASEPIWNAAVVYARQEMQTGLCREDKLRLAGKVGYYKRPQVL